MSPPEVRVSFLDKELSYAPDATGNVQDVPLGRYELQCFTRSSFLEPVNESAAKTGEACGVIGVCFGFAVRCLCAVLISPHWSCPATVERVSVPTP